MASTARPRVMFVDGHTWEAFSAMAGALREHGIDIDHVVSVPTTPRVKFLQKLDIPLYGKPIPLVHPAETGSAPRIELAALVRHVDSDSVIDIQAHDDLVPILATLDSTLTDTRLRVGPGIDPLVLSDKWVLAQTLKELGFPTPEVWHERSSDRFPVVVKTPIGFAGVGVHIAHDRAELDAAFDEVLRTFPGVEPFCQEFYGGGLIDSAGVAYQGELLVQGGYQAMPDPSDPMGPSLNVAPLCHPEMERLTAQVIKALGFTGFFNIDWVLDDDGNLYLIDFNARIFGSWPALQEAGVDFIGAYLYLLGLGPKPEDKTVIPGGEYGMLRFPFPQSATVAAVKAQRRKSLGIIERRRSFLGNRWARVSRVKVELAAIAERVRLRRGN